MADLVGEPQYFPRLPGQQSDVAPGSPLALLALFSEIARQRFRPGNGLAWEWHANPTPAATETNDPLAPRKIVIEPSFSERSRARNFRPAVYVDKGPLVPDKVAINNQAGQQIRTGFKGFYTIARTTIDFEVVGGTSGESAIVADILWFYFLAGREQIRATFGIHELGNPVLGKTEPGKRDKEEWVTHVTFETQVEFRWTTVPIAVPIREFVAKYHDADDPNFDTFLLKQYIK